MRIAVIGAGPAGSLVAAGLGRLGHHVLLCDRRADPLAAAEERGFRQLCVTPRGLRALAREGLDGALLAQALPLEGRVFHPAAGAPVRRPPRDPSRRNLAVGRAALTRLLLEGACAQPSVQRRFGESCVEVLPGRSAVLLRDVGGTVREELVDAVIGADGVDSEVRSTLVRAPDVDFIKRFSPFGYLDLALAAHEGRHRLDPPALHLWPRERFFVLATPGGDGTCHVTLVARHDEWEEWRDAGRLEARLTEALPELWPHLLPGGAAPAELAPITIVRCGAWTDGRFTALLGDAAHASAPFLGQGLNLALEDAAALLAALERHRGELPPALSAYGRRVEEGLACGDLSERAALRLLRMPPPESGAEDDALDRLDARGRGYAEVARQELPGWRPRVYADVWAPPSASSPEIPEALVERRELPAGTQLFARGEAATDLYLLEQGTVRIESPERGVVRLSGPTVVGEMGFFGDRSRTAAAITETPCRAGRVTYRDLEGLCDGQPELALAAVRRLSAVAIDRLKGRFHPRTSYVALVAPAAQAEALARWVLRHRERLSGEALLSEAGIGPLLEDRTNVRLARWVRALGGGGVTQLSRLVETGHVRAMVLLGEGPELEPLADACRANRVPCARTLAEADGLASLPA